MKILATVLVTLLCAFVRAAPVCVDGVCYPSEEAARADGVSEDRIKAASAEHSAAAGEAAPSLGFSLPTVAEEPADKSRTRVAIGYMKAPQMIAFLRNEPAAKELADHALWVILLLVLAGGLAANLTPCVLPLVPVNLSLVGKGAIRGAAYGLGITTAYGCLGLAAAFGGLAFGTIQSSPWFSLLAACVFVFLGLAVAEVFRIDFSRFRPRTKRSAPKDGTASSPSLLKPFALGAWSAVLAGACVEPILIDASDFGGEVGESGKDVTVRIKAVDEEFTLKTRRDLEMTQDISPEQKDFRMYDRFARMGGRFRGEKISGYGCMIYT